MQKNKVNGFTLIELLIVMIVLAGLATLFITNFPAAQRRARDARRISDIKQYQTALENYANVNGGTYPAASGNMTSLCATLNVSSCPDDPKASPNYQVASSTSEYAVWTQLEQKNSAGDTLYFVACSNGVSGETLAPSGPACPI